MLSVCKGHVNFVAVKLVLDDADRPGPFLPVSVEEVTL